MSTWSFMSNNDKRVKIWSVVKPSRWKRSRPSGSASTWGVVVKQRLADKHIWVVGLDEYGKRHVLWEHASTMEVVG